jgi:NAD(P)H-flavin reductase/DNA-binding IclR family transcriptional regulator/ferredoxin
MRCRVTVDPVDITVEATTDEPILQSLLRRGVMVPHGCRHGDCARCKALVTEGRVEMAPGYSRYALMDHERSEGYALLCSARPCGNVCVELDTTEEVVVDESRAVREWQAEVVARHQLTSDVWELELSVDPELNHAAGQYVDVVIGDEGDRRSYSIAIVPHPGRLSIVVRQCLGGYGSTWLCRHANAGSPLLLEGPYGTAHYRLSDAERVVLVAGGSGIGMIRAIAESVLREPGPRAVALYYGIAGTTDVAYRDLFRQWQEQFPHFEFVPVLSGPAATDWTGATGLVADVMAHREAGNTRSDVYTAGPPPMVRAVVAAARDLGIPAGHVYYDEFLESEADRFRLLCRAAEPVLRELAHETGGLVVLSSLDGGRDRCLLRREGADVLPASLAMGGRSCPAGLTPGGWCLLADLPDEQVAALSDGVVPGPTEGTSRAAGDLDAVLARIHETRRNGHSFALGEEHVGVAGIAVSLRVENSGPAALTCYLPQGRLGRRGDHLGVVEALHRAVGSVAGRLDSLHSYTSDATTLIPAPQTAGH